MHPSTIERTRIALVGYGRWGTNLARTASVSDSIELLAIADASEERRRVAASQYARARLYSTLDDVLRDKDIEAVVLATPATTHRRLALDVLKAGRHVLVEKPLALSVQAADEIVSTAEDAGLTVMAGHTFLYSPPVRRLRDYITEGTLGRIRYLYSHRLNLGTVRQDCDALWNFAPHDVSIALYLLRERPTSVSATSLAVLQSGMADVVFAYLTFPSGVGLHVHVSWLDPRKIRQMTVVGEKKMAVYDDVSVDAKISLYDSAATGAHNLQKGSGTLGEFQWQTRSGDILIPKLRMEEPLQLELEDFASCCRNGGRPVADGEHAVDVVKVLAAIDLSAKSGGCERAIDW